MLNDLANDDAHVALKQAAENREGWRHRKNVKNLLYSRRPLQVDNIFAFIRQVVGLFRHNNIFVFIRQVAPVPASWLFKTSATS